MQGSVKLAEYLAGNGITQAQFAGRIGVTQALISRLCRGQRGVSMTTAARIESETYGAVPVGAWAVKQAEAAA